MDSDILTLARKIRAGKPESIQAQIKHLTDRLTALEKQVATLSATKKNKATNGN